MNKGPFGYAPLNPLTLSPADPCQINIEVTQMRFACSPEMSPRWPQNRPRGFIKGCLKRKESKLSLRYCLVYIVSLCSYHCLFLPLSVLNCSQRASMICRSSLTKPWRQSTNHLKPSVVFWATLTCSFRTTAFAACCPLTLVNISTRGKSMFYMFFFLYFKICLNGDASVVLLLCLYSQQCLFYSMLFAREPQCVNLQSKNLARDIQRLVQGTSLKVTKKGCCWWDQFNEPLMEICWHVIAKCTSQQPRGLWQVVSLGNRWCYKNSL